MEPATVRDSANDSQSVPQQPNPQSAKPSSRKTRQKKQTNSSESSRPAPNSSNSRRPPGRRSNNNATTAVENPQTTSTAARPATDQHQQDAARFRGIPIPSYPAPLHYMMNHNYHPINPSPFTQQHPSGGYAPTSSVNSATGPGMPSHSSQYYPMHPTYPPAPHGYAPYYPQQMMMYGAPRSGTSVPEQPQPPSAPSPVPAPATPAIGKRKRKLEPSRSKVTVEKDSDQEGPSGSDVPAKRSTPAATTPTASDSKKRTKTQRACDSCRSRKIRCDVLAESEPPLCQHCKQYGFECTFFLPITETRFKKKKMEEEAAEKEKEKSTDTRRNTLSPQAEPGDRRVFGPTAAVHLLHSQPIISSRIYESYDQRYHHTWEVSKNGDVLQNLLNAYFKEIAPLLPVVSQEEFLANPSPSPILLYSICLVAAARREVPQSVFDSIRYAVNGVIKAEDVLSTASIANVQALLILSMMGDSHSQFVPNALSALWIRLGTAIRMTLGLHRAESVKQSVELRRRLWGACVICDRWTSLTYGHPYMIDVQDCDARLPSSGDPNDLYMDELVRLSVILGRVLKTIYSPSGLMFTTDDMLYSLLSDLESWKKNLPGNLQYCGPDTPRDAGLLHLLYCSVCMIFWRVFMRISYACPAHLKFGLTVETWTSLVQLTGESIDWLDTHERMYDVWLLVPYAATSCALVQYHTWARRQDAEAATKLRKLRDCVRRWEGSISPDHMSARRKTAEIIALLYEATQGPPLPLDQPPPLNPTGGVKGQRALSGLEYKKDPSRPGGGFFVAHGEARNYEDLPRGTIVTSSDDEVEEATENSQCGGSSMVTITPLPSARGDGTSFPNMNPALNGVKSDAPSSVQVLNVLDVPQASNTLEQFAMADVGLLEGIPGGMFDWGMSCVQF
ncbi:fungal-specific transcription factor domain-containing protein [Suillus subluteus]|nr:fungal-specific transcription factor domain-containing protein [Suillus subluteus]